MSDGYKIYASQEYIDNKKFSYDDLEDKPFYTEVVAEVSRDIISLQEVEPDSSVENIPDGYLAYTLVIQGKIPFIDKGQYNLTIDGTAYPTKMVFQQESFWFGDISILGMGETTGEPFYGACFQLSNDGWGLAIYYQTNETTHTIGLSYIGDYAPIIAEGTYTFEETSSIVCHFFENMSSSYFKADDKYNLTLNGEIYKNIGWLVFEDENRIIGNLSIANGGESTGENFLISFTPNDTDDNFGDLGVATSLPAGEYTFSLEKMLPSTTTETIHKIDSKYLPDEIETRFSEIESSLSTVVSDYQTASDLIGGAE